MTSDPRSPATTVHAFPASKTDSSLAGGPGGPHGPEIEMRIRRLEDMFARLEALMKSVADRLRKVEIDLAEVKGRITHLPSTWAMVRTMLGGQVALAAAILKIVAAH